MAAIWQRVARTGRVDVTSARAPTFVADSPFAGAVRPSPHFGPRIGQTVADMVIAHYTGMPTAQGALDWLCDPASSVSCHYFVFEDGRIIQLVPEADRAWHAGRSFWAGTSDINSRSIGIEIANPGHSVPAEPFGYPDFPPAQIMAVLALIADLSHRLAIPKANILAHSDVAPGRKIDPGERFPWDRLATAGFGLWVAPEPLGEDVPLGKGDSGPEVAALQSALAALGFGITNSGEYDAETETIVTAFQRHWRPARIDGRADFSTRNTLARLLASRDTGT